MFARPELLLDDIDKVAAGRDSGQVFTFSDIALSSSEVGQGLILLSTGRMPPAFVTAAGDNVVSEQRQQAARYVVASWFFTSSSTLYQVLGVAPDCPAEFIRENYRRLMGLVHPDTRPVGFPDDSASRVNFAYGIVSDDAHRSTYDDSLLLAKQQRAFPPPSVTPVIDIRAVQTKTVGQSQSLFDRFRSAVPQVKFGHGLLVAAALFLVPMGFAIFALVDHEARPQIIAARTKLLMTTAIESPPETASLAVAPVTPAASSELPIAAALRSTPGTAAAVGAVRATFPQDAPGSTARNTTSASADAALATSAKDAPEVKIPAASTPSEPSEPRSLSASSVTRARSVVDDRAPAQADTASPPKSATRSQPAQMAAGDTAERGVTASAPTVTRTTASTPAPDAAARELRAEPMPQMAAVRPAAVAPTVPVTAHIPEHRVNAADADDVLVRLSGAYEAGSIAAFSKVFAPAMVGRGQVLSDYERVFQQTRQRSIRFNDFKHKLNGERLISSGFATVTTIDNDNRSTSHRLFLEIEIGRLSDGLKIERLRNYPLN